MNGREREASRPDPDGLLAGLKLADGRDRRGQLKIFLGACAGVGKTYAMLEAAQAQRRAGVAVMAGVVVTHGRAETMALCAGIPELPLRDITYRAIRLNEFDLEAALKLRPQLLLVDELAHTNAPGLRHPKRWQDVKELIDNGINVYTTLNIQHLESLNDVVAQITGLTIQETVPDSFVASADAVELVDLPVEDLLTRLAEGKVYFAEQAQRAREHFFRPGNIGALREMALRYTAEKVNAQVQTYRQTLANAPTWPTSDRLLVLVGPSPSSARLLRHACRLAGVLRCPWLALHVATPAQQRLPREEQERTVAHLRLAAQLGAETITLTGTGLVSATLAFARARNVTRILIGKPQRRSVRDWLGISFTDQLVRRSSEIDVIVTSGEALEGAGARPLRWQRPPRGTKRRYGLALAVVLLCTLACFPLRPLVDPTNLVMVYLLGVVMLATRLGRGPAMLASLMSVLAFDFFFVPPHLTFAVADTQYLFTFFVMLAVAVIISNLTVRLRAAVEQTQLREQRTAALSAFSHALATRRGQADIIRAAVEHIAEYFRDDAAVLLPDAAGNLQVRAAHPLVVKFNDKELGVARWAYDRGQLAGAGTENIPDAGWLYVPLAASHGAVGVLALVGSDVSLLPPEELLLLESMARQTALALEVERLTEVTRGNQVQIEAERLRNALLSSVSHDLRTPLAVITGSASGLLDDRRLTLTDGQRELLQNIFDEAGRMNRQIGNLLEMSRLQAGALKLRKEPQPLEETIGSACRQLESPLRGRELTISIPHDLPLVPVDGVLCERVFFNLLENAVKYTPAGSPLAITAAQRAGEVLVEIRDHGSGLAAGDEELIFQKFRRGAAQGRTGGVGLGLTICRGIIDAHGGRLWAANHPDGGAVFSFTLPLAETPPLSAAAEER